jgi:DNA-binding MarR family transcriptional regulator
MSQRLPSRQEPVKSSRSTAGDAFSWLVVQVFQLDGLLTAMGDALAKPARQTSARWRVLAAVEEGPLTVSQIARAWGLARQSVQRVADALVQGGWAAYQKNPGHRRAQLLRLTSRGLRALRMIQAAQRSWADALGEEIGEADLRQASSVLARVLHALRSEPGGRDPEALEGVGVAASWVDDAETAVDARELGVKP